MTYTPQTWVDYDPTKAVSAARMTHIEDGIVEQSNVHASDVFKQALTLGADWAIRGDPWEDPTYTRIGRLMHLQGYISRAAGPPVFGETVFTLPVGFRPAENVDLFCATGTFGNSPANLTLNVAGVAAWTGGSGATPTLLSLTPITFILP